MPIKPSSVPPPARSFFLHKIPSTPPSPPLSPQHHLLHSALGAGTQLDAEPAASHTPAKTSRERVFRHVGFCSFFQPPPLEWPLIILALHSRPRSTDIWLPMSLHGACRRNNNAAPREARAHNTPHATPSTDKSCTSRAANIPHSTTAPAPVGRHPSSTLSSPHHWLIHLSKARCVQSLPPRQCKARAHTIPHADAEKRSWHQRV